jgi:hypothetical protein
MNKKIINKIIKESLVGYKIPTKKSCSCGCNTCDLPKTNAVTLNESIASREILSEGLKYHIDNKKPLTEQTYRAGSQKYFDLWAEARALYSRNILEISHPEDLEILTETNLGEFGILEDGTKVPLDFIMEDDSTFNYYFENAKEKLSKPHKITNVLKKRTDRGDNYIQINYVHKYTPNEPYDSEGHFVSIFYDNNEQLSLINKEFGLDLSITESKKENKPIGKPMRDSSGGKAYKVYVRDPKTKKIKTVRFGSGGLKAKINNPKARQAFAKRHKCGTGEPKTSARYWSCRLPRFSKLLGLKGSFSGFW